MNDKISITTLEDSGVTSTIEIFMSYGLLNQLCNIIGSPERIVSIDFDPELSYQVMTTLLIPRHPSGTPKMTMEEMLNKPLAGMSMVESEKLLDWTKEHVLDFFTRRASANLAMMKGERMSKLQELQVATNSLQAGTSPSASPT